tara:strand:- start:126 stop:1088 length:963 start_codon:yes stop_codon:yes gene_type:complete
MNKILRSKLSGASVWNAKTFKSDNNWIYSLSSEDLAEIDIALKVLRSNNLIFPNFSKTDFQLPNLHKKLKVFSNELEHGRGFIVLSGFPINSYNEDDINAFYYGLGLNMGQPVPQNFNGDLIGTVMNIGDKENKNTRVYETNLYLPYHTDPSDVVGLFCIRMAKTGGLSSLVSVPSVYNILLQEFPEYVGLFYKQWYYAHLGEELPSPTSLFAWHEGKLNFRYLRQYIELGHDLRKSPLSPVEIEALDILDSIIARPELRVDMMLKPGDIQFANNHLVLHSRNGFEDSIKEEERRKLLRLWLKMDNARKQPPEFPGRNGF